MRWTVGTFDGSGIGGNSPLDLGLLVSKPVARPNAMELPPKTFKMILAEAVAITGSGRRVVAGTVTFDRQNHPPGLLRMLGNIVNEVARAAVLGDDFDAGGLQTIADIDLERVERRLVERRVAEVATATCRVLQIETQQLHTLSG